jgi:hypothetical protein
VQLPCDSSLPVSDLDTLLSPASSTSSFGNPPALVSPVDCSRLTWRPSHSLLGPCAPSNLARAVPPRRTKTITLSSTPPYPNIIVDAALPWQILTLTLCSPHAPSSAFVTTSKCRCRWAGPWPGQAGTSGCVVTPPRNRSLLSISL